MPDFQQPAIVLEGTMGLPGFMSELKYISAEGNRKEAIEQACSVISEKYEQRRKEHEALQRKQSDSEAKFWLGAGALALWLFSK